MDSIPVVRSAALWPVVDKLELMGVPYAVHLEAVGLPDEALERPDLVVPERPVWELFDRLRKREGIDDIGFQIGASHHVTDVPGLGPLVGGHSTLLKTAEAFCTLLQSHNNCWDYWLERAPEGVRLCRRATFVDVGQWPLEQYAVSYMTDLVQMAAGDSWWPKEIWLQSEVELTPSEQQWLRDARLHFGSPVTAISFPRSLLPKRPRSLNGPRDAEVAVKVLSCEFLPIFEEVVRTYLPTGRVGLERLGAAIGVHPRTIQRRLARDGTTFQKVLDGVRLEIAQARLEEGAMPIAEIARELGYRRTAAFSNSFRRWTGVSPRAYRAANVT